MDEHRLEQDRREIPEPVESDTRRATGMGNPGTFPDEEGREDGREAQIRRAASGKLEEAAGKVRQMGEQAASKNRLLTRVRPLAHNAAGGIEGAADYVRTHEIDEMRTDLEGQIRRHPLAAIGIAFLAGYALRRIL